MERSHPRTLVWIVAALAFIAVFGVLLYAGGAWTQTVTYTVAITTGRNIAWNLSVPRPLADLAVVSAEHATYLRSSNSPYGGMYELSGSGNGTVTFGDTGSYFDFRSPPAPVAMSLGFNETGSLQVWAERESSNASSPIALNATSVITQSRADERLECGTSGFSGSLREGWNLMTLSPGDCTLLIADPSFALLSVPFLLAGLVSAYIGVDRGSKFGWRW